MGKTVMCTLKDTSGCTVKREERLSDIPKLLLVFEKSAAELMKQTDADHVLYACKIYNTYNELVAVQFCREPMDDATFYKVTGRTRGALIYALHSRR